MWRYNPCKLSNGSVVDELSLALALREDADERVEEAVEEMLDNLWRRIDGSEEWMDMTDRWGSRRAC